MSTITSQNNNGVDGVRLCTEWHQERWRLAMITFTYCHNRKGETYILTYKTNAQSFASISKLKAIKDRG